MRPVRIELEGFSAFRAREVVDLSRLTDSDTAFFSLTGATGSGKSSLVDAMIFALYGRIPRLGAREVAPVISAGADRSRVRLDFEADGDLYTAVREIRRTKSGGASVKEARLQLGDTVLSDGAASVTEAVEELLGLGFDDFTRTVVLPQGDFARFLHATPSERQNLLRGLLGMDVYSAVRAMAGERRAAAQARADTARARLASLEAPSAEQLEGLRARLTALETLDSRVAGWEEELAASDKALAEAEYEFTRLGDARERLRALAAPARLEELTDLVAQAVATLHEAEERHDRALAELQASESELEKLPDPGRLAAIRKARDEKESLVGLIAQLDPETSRRASEDTAARVTEAELAVAEAQRRLDESRMTHAAHALAATLVAGEACPVCRQTVAGLPPTGTAPEMTLLEKELAAARQEVTGARDVAAQARDRHTETETRRAELEVRLEALEAELAGSPSGDELDRLEDLATKTREKTVAARTKAEEARGGLETARRAHEDLMDDQRALGRRLREAQQVVADLKPPITESDDVGVQWKELLGWRDETLADIADRVETAGEEADAARDRAGSVRARIAGALAEHGVDVSGSFRASLATETERARQAVARAEQTAAEVASLTTEESRAGREASVAKALADHLRSDGFEKWMMSSALENLVVGANGLLRELSDGGYSLRASEGNFAVVDHRNADELRPVSTLSGGETFLVSLALAMSLAEIHAAHGEARLEAVILDEGFGTLDPETLDTVASLLEELAAGRGLMVGVITHVKDLAERASVRFEVVRGPRGSTVRELT